MPLPEIGRPLPRAADAYVGDEKWIGYVLADRGHGDDWRRAFGSFDADELWSMIADALFGAPVAEMHVVEGGGITCRVPISITIGSRTRTVRTVWHFEHDGSPPRLVTAFPTT